MARCPLLNKDCIESKCAWWSTVYIRDVKTQEVTPKQECVVTTIPNMVIELIKNTGGVQAAVEDSRNKNVERQDALLQLIAHPLRLMR